MLDAFSLQRASSDDAASVSAAAQRVEREDLESVGELISQFPRETTAALHDRNDLQAELRSSEANAAAVARGNPHHVFGLLQDCAADDAR
jgi:hypothetical protein